MDKFEKALKVDHVGQPPGNAPTLVGTSNKIRHHFPTPNKSGYALFPRRDDSIAKDLNYGYKNTFETLTREQAAPIRALMSTSDYDFRSNSYMDPRTNKRSVDIVDIISSRADDGRYTNVHNLPVGPDKTQSSVSRKIRNKMFAIDDARIRKFDRRLMNTHAPEGRSEIDAQRRATIIRDVVINTPYSQRQQGIGWVGDRTAVKKAAYLLHRQPELSSEPRNYEVKLTQTMREVEDKVAEGKTVDRFINDDDEVFTVNVYDHVVSRDRNTGAVDWIDVRVRDTEKIKFSELVDRVSYLRRVLNIRQGNGITRREIGNRVHARNLVNEYNELSRINAEHNVNSAARAIKGDNVDMAWPRAAWDYNKAKYEERMKRNSDAAKKGIRDVAQQIRDRNTVAEALDGEPDGPLLRVVKRFDALNNAEAKDLLGDLASAGEGIDEKDVAPGSRNWHQHKYEVNNDLGRKLFAGQQRIRNQRLERNDAKSMSYGNAYFLPVPPRGFDRYGFTSQIPEIADTNAPFE